MKKEIINNSHEFETFSYGAANQDENHLVASLQNDTQHHHSFRFAERKLVLITNETSKEVNYFINLRFGKEVEPSKNVNDSDFFFGGEDKSLYMFSNLTFKASAAFPLDVLPDKNSPIFKKHDYNINIGQQIHDADKFIFMGIYHHSKLTFFNIKFVNDTCKKLVIQTHNNAVAQFINCEFIGDFEFVKHDDSVIINHG